MQLHRIGTHKQRSRQHNVQGKCCRGVVQRRLYGCLVLGVCVCVGGVTIDVADRVLSPSLMVIRFDRPRSARAYTTTSVRHRTDDRRAADTQYSSTTNDVDRTAGSANRNRNYRCYTDRARVLTTFVQPSVQPSDSVPIPLGECVQKLSNCRTHD